MRVGGLYTHSYKDSHQKVGVVLVSSCSPQIFSPQVWSKIPNFATTLVRSKHWKTSWITAVLHLRARFFSKNPTTDSASASRIYPVYTPPEKLTAGAPENTGTPGRGKSSSKQSFSSSMFIFRVYIHWYRIEDNQKRSWKICLAFPDISICAPSNELQ